MPSLVIFGNFTTRPFAGDDLHIACIVLSVYRFIQAICLLALIILAWQGHAQGDEILINGIPYRCPQFSSFEFNFTYNALQHSQNETLLIQPDVVEVDHFGVTNQYISVAAIYLVGDVVWIVMVWSAASVGTVTEPGRRDKYLRNLLKVKIFATNLMPILLLTFGTLTIAYYRRNNFGCGHSVPDQSHTPEASKVLSISSVLIVTYALELLVFPAMIVNGVTRWLRKRYHLFNRDRRRVRRFEFKFGLFLKFLQVVTRGRAGGADLKMKGELSDFAAHVMHLMNNETKMDITLSDMYVGLRMLARVQAERRVDAIKQMAYRSKRLQAGGLALGGRRFDVFEEPRGRADCLGQARKHRSSMKVLDPTDSGGYEIEERFLLLETNDEDQAIMDDAAHFVKYASYIYVKLRDIVANEFMLGEEEMEQFIRPLDTLFQREYHLTSIGLDNSYLCYANFVNGVAETPYAIMLDDKVKKVVIVVRGTRSLEDLVVDLQFTPESLAEVGKVCGFQGNGYHCHKGFLLRAKWMFNDIHARGVLKTLYSLFSPYRNYQLVVCGHSLGGGCASILSLMLRPNFPSVQCFAYEPPGCVFDSAMAKLTEEFIISFVRNDDMIPRLSYHNVDKVRDEFFNILARIKIPKIKLFFDLKIPCSDEVMAQRNAHVLKRKATISQDTDYYKKLQTYRSERAEKRRVGVNSTQLFIAGRIIHLVDIHGTNSAASYVPYYARRREFNQVVISKRMIADHDIHFLVDIFNKTRLCGDSNKISYAFSSTPHIVEEEDNEEVDIRLFICCANPYGKLPILMSLLVSTAFGLALWTHFGCRFYISSLPPNLPDPILLKRGETFRIAYGLYMYSIVQCISLGRDGVCDTLTEYEKIGNCLPYPIFYIEDSDMFRAQAFSFVVETVGFLALTIILVSQCFAIRKVWWKVVAALLLLATLFQGLVLLPVRDCKDMSNERPSDECQFGQNAVGCIVACCLWFICAVSALNIARVGEKNV